MIQPPANKKESVMVQPQRGLGGLYPDIMVEESHEDALTITEHPVEQGAAINDHAYVKPKEVTLRGGVTNAKSSGGNPARDFYDKLLELQAKREPFDIITGKRQYKNMLLESLSETTTDATENCLLFVAQCREVIIVSTQTTSVPPSSKHASPAKTGAITDKGQQQAQPRQSILKSGLG